MPLEDLATNNLFLSMLSGAGAAVAGSDSAAAQMNPLIQQTIGAQSKAKAQQKYFKWLQDIIAGGGKFTMDKDKFSIGGESSILQSLGGETRSPMGTGGGFQTPDLNVAPTGSPGATPITYDPRTVSDLNPSISPPVLSGADLAGLTSQDVSQALAGAVSVQSLMQSKISDVADRALKLRQIVATERLGEAQIGKLKAEESKLTPSITIPGTDIKLTSEQWVDWYKAANKDERTAAIKNYEYDLTQREKLGLPPRSFEQFQDSSRSNYKKMYDEYVADEKSRKVPDSEIKSFNVWYFDSLKAGAINLGDIVERKKATEDIEAQKYFTNPKGLAADVSKHISSNEVQNRLIRFSNDPQKLKMETVRASEEFIVGKITGAGGKIIESKLEGRTFVWEVKWPDGTTSEVRHAN